MRPPRLTHCAICAVKLLTYAPPVADEIAVCHRPRCIRAAELGPDAPFDETLRAYQRDRDAAIDALSALRAVCCERDLARVAAEVDLSPAAMSRVVIADEAYEAILAARPVARPTLPVIRLCGDCGWCWIRSTAYTGATSPCRQDPMVDRLVDARAAPPADCPLRAIGDMSR